MKPLFLLLPYLEKISALVAKIFALLTMLMVPESHWFKAGRGGGMSVAVREDFLGEGGAS